MGQFVWKLSAYVNSSTSTDDSTSLLSIYLLFKFNKRNSFLGRLRLYLFDCRTYPFFPISIQALIWLLKIRFVFQLTYMDIWYPPI